MKTTHKTAALVAASLISASLITAAGAFLSGALQAQEAPAATPGPAMLPVTDVPFFADWTTSPHARRTAAAFNNWNAAGAVPVDCARCHSTPGFLDYIGADGTEAGKVDHPAPTGTVITCVACHNGKTLAMTSVTFPSGLRVDKLDPADARCMTCHQGRESAVSVANATAGIGEDEIGPRLGFINIHYRAAGATLMGTLARGAVEYPGKKYDGPRQHVAGYNACSGCHNVHTAEVRVADCQACHKEVTNKASIHLIRVGKTDRDGNGDVTDGVGHEMDRLAATLLNTIKAYAKTVSGKAIAYNTDAFPYFFIDTNGNGVADKEEAVAANRFNAWTPRLLKAAYNYQFVAKDPGSFSHNPGYTNQILYDSIADLGTKVPTDLSKAKRP